MVMQPSIEVQIHRVEKTLLMVMQPSTGAQRVNCHIRFYHSPLFEVVFEVLAHKLICRLEINIIGEAYVAIQINGTFFNFHPYPGVTFNFFIH